MLWVGFPEPRCGFPSSSLYPEALVSALQCISVVFAVARAVLAEKTAGVVSVPIPTIPIIVEVYSFIHLCIESNISRSMCFAGAQSVRNEAYRGNHPGQYVVRGRI